MFFFCFVLLCFVCFVLFWFGFGLVWFGSVSFVCLFVGWFVCLFVCFVSFGFVLFVCSFLCFVSFGFVLLFVRFFVSFLLVLFGFVWLFVWFFVAHLWVVCFLLFCCFVAYFLCGFFLRSPVDKIHGRSELADGNFAPSGLEKMEAGWMWQSQSSQICWGFLPGGRVIRRSSNQSSTSITFSRGLVSDTSSLVDLLLVTQLWKMIGSQMYKYRIQASYMQESSDILRIRYLLYDIIIRL